jgi:Trk-type K+ transport system membrane component
VLLAFVILAEIRGEPSVHAFGRRLTAEVQRQAITVALMLIGRLGPITLATALALRDRTRRYELPEERPIVG